MKKQKPVLSELSAADEALFSQFPSDFFNRFKTMQDINGFMDKLLTRRICKSDMTGKNAETDNIIRSVALVSS